MMKITVKVHAKTCSEANRNENHFEAAKRHKRQQFLVFSVLRPFKEKIGLPCRVTLTRFSSRFLDAEENLPMAFKWIKDEVGAFLCPERIITYQRNGRLVKNKGRCDDSPDITWHYAQEKSAINYFTITFETPYEVEIKDI